MAPRRLTKAAKAKAEKEAAEKAVFAAAEAAAATLLAAAAAQTAAAAPPPAAPDEVPPAPEGAYPDLPRLPQGREGEPEGELASEHENDRDSDNDNVVPIKTKVVEATGKKKKKDAVLLTDDQEIALFNWLKEHPELYSKAKNLRYVKADVKNELWDSIAADYGKTGKFYVILH